MQVNQVCDNMPEFVGFFVMAVALGRHAGYALVPTRTPWSPHAIC